MMLTGLRMAAAGLVLALGSISAAAQPVDLELILAVDVSGSIDQDEALLQRQGYVSALVNPEVIGAIRAGFHGRVAITYIEWADSGHRRVIADWTLVEDERGARALAGMIAEAPVTTGLWTSISGVIAFALPRFDDNSFEGVRRVIDISGDGPNNNGDPVTPERDRAVAAGVTINGLPIINDRPSPWGMTPMPNLDWYYEDCVIGGPGAFIIVAEGFGAFAAAIRRKLILEIAGYPTPPVLPVLTATAAVPVQEGQPWQRPSCNTGEQRRSGSITPERSVAGNFSGP